VLSIDTKINDHGVLGWPWMTLNGQNALLR